MLLRLQDLMKILFDIFDGDSITGSFDFQATRQGVYEFMEKATTGQHSGYRI